MMNIHASSNISKIDHHFSSFFCSEDSQRPRNATCKSSHNERSIATTSENWELLEDDDMANSLTEAQADSDFDDEDSDFLLAEDQLLSDIDDDGFDVTDSALTVYSSMTDTSDTYTSDSLLRAVGAKAADCKDPPLMPEHDSMAPIESGPIPAAKYRFSLPAFEKPGLASVASQPEVTASHLSASDELEAERHSEAPSPPLTPSLFPGRPPTIHFPLPSEECE